MNVTQQRLVRLQKYKSRQWAVRQACAVRWWNNTTLAKNSLNGRASCRYAKCSKCWMNQLVQSRFVSVLESQTFLIMSFVKLLQGIASCWLRWRLSCGVTCQKLRLLSRNVPIKAENDFLLATSTFLQVPVPVSAVQVPVQVPVLKNST